MRMTVFEALLLMITFGSLVVVMLSTQKSNHPISLASI